MRISDWSSDVCSFDLVVETGATIHADEASPWDVLHARYEAYRINHSEAYSLNGACTNMAESFFSRLRRAEVGTHHHIAGPYLASYAAELAWREDKRRTKSEEPPYEIKSLKNITYTV